MGRLTYKKKYHSALAVGLVLCKTTRHSQLKMERTLTSFLRNPNG